MEIKMNINQENDLLRTMEIRKLQLSKSNNWLKQHHIPMNRKHNTDKKKDFPIFIELFGESFSKNLFEPLKQVAKNMIFFAKLLNDFLNGVKENERDQETSL